MKQAALLVLGVALLVWPWPDASLAQDVAQDDAAQDTAAYSRKGADSCLACHDDDRMVLALFGTKHAVPGDARGPFGSGQLQCEACHGPGGEHAGRVRRGEERPPILSFSSDDPHPAGAQDAMCLECHQSDAGSHWHSGPHADNDVTCASCHTLHAPRDAVLETASQNEACFACHTQQRRESRKPFAHPLHEGKMACSACHSPHGSSDEHSLVRENTNATCYQCHAEKRGPFLWEHAPVADDCSSCHAPHGANTAGMLTRRAPLLCQSCHSQSGHPSVAFNETDLAGGTASRFVLANSCMNCHTQVHGSNHPSGSKLMR